MTHPTKLISISINAPVATVYRFAAKPENLPQWATGLSSGIRKEKADWVTDSPMGKVIVKFPAENAFGILDHDVTLPSGETVYNPVRVQANGDGSEVIFTLYRRSGMSEEEFQADAKHVMADLAKLKAIVESRG